VSRTSIATPAPVIDADLKKLMRTLKLGRMLDTVVLRPSLTIFLPVCASYPCVASGELKGGGVRPATVGRGRLGVASPVGAVRRGLLAITAVTLARTRTTERC
jgi:hypothetical protein